MYIQENNGMFNAEFTISGIKNAKKFDIFSKFWSSMRKRIREEDQIDLVAIFIEDSPTIRCMMLPNRASISGGDYGKEEFEDKMETLKKDLPDYLDMYIEYLEKFKDSKEYDVYRKLLKKEEEFADDRVFHEVINPFLIEVGLKTLEDEIRKEQEKARLKKESSITRP